MRAGVGRRHEQRGYGQVLDLQASLADAPTLHLDAASASKRFDYVNHTEGKKHRVWFDDDETVSTAGCERLLSPGCGWLTATALCRSW